MAKPTRPPWTPDQIRQHEIKLIQIGRRQLYLDDGTYRAMLRTHGNVASSTELDAAGRAAMLAALVKGGFVVRPRQSAPTTPAVPQRDAVYDLMVSLWDQLHAVGAVRLNNEHALRHYIARQTGLSAYQFCSSQQCTKVIEALKLWLKRAQEQASIAQHKGAGK